jgi:hypothetical protein
MFLVRCLFVVISSSIWAQQTNIEKEEFLQPKLIQPFGINDIIDNKYFEIIDIRSLSIYLYDLEMKNKPVIFITSENKLLYNWTALNNDQMVCPYGSHILKKEEIIILNRSDFEFSTILKYHGSCDKSVDINRFDEYRSYTIGFKPSTLKLSDDSLYMGVSLNNIINFNHKSDFLPTRCVEDLTYSFKNNVYSYASLMPQKFNQLKQRLAQEALFRSQNTNLNGIQGIFNVGFNHSGENVSTLSYNQNQDFWNSLMPTVKNKQHLPSPYYESIFLSTKDAITVKLLEIDDYAKMQKGKKEAFQYKTYFKIPVDADNFSKLYNTWLKNRYSTNRFGNVTNLDQFFNYTATVKVEPFKYQVAVDNTLQKTPAYFVSKFHLSGSLTPLKSLVFPGLGSKTLRFDNIHKTHKALAITSLALSAISFTVSEVFYQDYRRNINSEPFSKNYYIANSLHKVGLVSLGIYPVISISDILSCYIKCKNDGIQLAGNKRIQRQVNKEINDNRRKNIYLCRD